jgi:hypothetical protein
MSTRDGSDVVWSVDYHSGIDILRFSQRAAVPTTAHTDASWLAKKNVTDVFALAERELCRAGVDATAEQHDRMHVATTLVAGWTPSFQELAASR